MAKAEVDAGVCGHSAVIEVRQVSNDTVQVRIDSACEMLTAMNEELQAVKWRGKGHEVFRRIPDSAIYRSAGCHIRHPGCPIPAAIIKAIEVEVGVAVPKDVSIRVYRDGTGAEEPRSKGEGEPGSAGEEAAGGILAGGGRPR